MSGIETGPKTHTLATLVRGEYLVEAAPSSTSPLLVGFHGYGETAHEQLAELKTLPGHEKWTLCAIQGLHPFYKRSTGEVVRSWMTKENREAAIEDNIRYVAAVVAEVRRIYGATERLVFSGFSQGVAMTWRAAVRCGFPCHGVLALAGDVPSEIPVWSGGRLPPVLLGRGLKDEWYSEAKMGRDLELLGSLGAKVSTCLFNDGHVWHDDYRQAAGRFLAEISA